MQIFFYIYINLLKNNISLRHVPASRQDCCLHQVSWRLKLIKFSFYSAQLVSVPSRPVVKQQLQSDSTTQITINPRNKSESFNF